MSPARSAKELTVFSPATFIENIAVRANGHLLLSTFEQSRLYGFDPNTPGASPEVVATFPDVTALTGLAEIAPDVWAVGAGVKGGMMKFNGDMSVFTISFTGEAPEPKFIARVPGTSDVGSFLNGMTCLPEKKHVVLGADSWTGEIHRIDTQTGHVDVAFGDPSLRRAGDDVKTVPVGVNGIRAVGKHLYFANSALGLFGRFPVTVDGDKAGDVEIIARFPDGETTMGSAYDDFAVAPDESVAYIGTHPNRIMKVDIETRRQDLFFGGNDEVRLNAPTSAALSRDGKVLYVCTGGIDMTGGQMERTGAQVVQLELE